MEANILVVDDDDDFNSLLSNVFSQASYKITSCKSPKEVIGLTENQEFDLIITDYQMPGINGAELVQMLKYRKIKTPVIMVSAFMDAQSVRTLINIGIKGIFLKPLNIFYLLDYVKAVLSEEQASIEIGEEGEISESQLVNLPYRFTSYPCKAEKSRELASNLYGARNFKSNLILIGPKGSPFDALMADFINFESDKKSLFMPLDHKNLSREYIYGEASKRSSGSNESITLIIKQLEQLDKASRENLLDIVKNGIHEDFNKEGLRFIFATTSSMDNLLDQDIINADLYFQMASNEIKVPALNACREDIPLLAQQLINDICSREGMQIPPQLNEEAGRYLQASHWRGSYLELAEFMQRLVRSTDGSTLTVNDIEVVAHNSMSGEEMFTLKQHLRDLRDDYVNAVYQLSNRDMQRSAGILGLEEEFLKTIIK